MNNIKKTFRGVKDGVYQEFEVLYTFKSLKTMKDYIIYTDNTYDQDNDLNIYSSIYYPQHSKKELENIQNEEDWDIVEKFLKDMVGDKHE